MNAKDHLKGWAERQPTSPGLAAGVDVPVDGEGEPAVGIPDPGNLEARLIRHAEALRTLLGVREFAAADELRPYDEELHSAAYRLLTTIDLMTQDAEPTETTSDETGDRP
ncbi:hypothetical protein ACFC07_21815 [Streptomyces sp. NPDC056099]|uniref:hypothetical protein n=1 Tax=unclassified Streptomyces TaxID=2593676 RepID=UPI0035DA5BDE